MCTDLSQRASMAIAAAILCMIIGVLPATGADLNLTIQKMYLLEEVFVDTTKTQARGFTKTLRIPGKSMLAVVFGSRVAWDEKTKRMSIPSKQIMLTDKNGKSGPLLGEMRYYGGLYKHVSSIQHTRPQKWKDTEPRTKKHYLIFLVDGKSLDYTMKIGTAEVKLKTPDRFSTLNPAMIAKYAVTGAESVKEIPGTTRINYEKYETRNVALSETFIKVNVNITPQVKDNHFFWHTSWFALKDDLGGFIPVAGEIHNKDLSNGVSHNEMKSTGAEKWKTIPATFYFSVSSKAKHFQFYCAGQPVAEFSIP